MSLNELNTRMKQPLKLNKYTSMINLTLFNPVSFEDPTFSSWYVPHT